MLRPSSDQRYNKYTAQGQAELAQRLADLRGSVGSFQDVTPNVVFGPAASPDIRTERQNARPHPRPDKSESAS